MTEHGLSQSDRKPCGAQGEAGDFAGDLSVLVGTERQRAPPDGLRPRTLSLNEARWPEAQRLSSRNVKVRMHLLVARGAVARQAGCCAAGRGQYGQCAAQAASTLSPQGTRPTPGSACACGSTRPRLLQGNGDSAGQGPFENSHLRWIAIARSSSASEQIWAISSGPGAVQVGC